MQKKGKRNSEVDALGIVTISRGCFERCCSNKTPPYHSNLSFVTLRNWRPTLLRAPAYRTPSEASPRRRCGHASRFLWKRYRERCLKQGARQRMCRESLKQQPTIPWSSLPQCTPRPCHTRQLSDRVGGTTRKYPRVYRLCAEAMNEARLSHLPSWVPSEGFFVIN